MRFALAFVLVRAHVDAHTSPKLGGETQLKPSVVRNEVRRGTIFSIKLEERGLVDLNKLSA